MSSRLTVARIATLACTAPLISWLILSPWECLSKLVIGASVVLSLLLGTLCTFTFRLYMSEKHVSHPQIPERVKDFQRRIIEDIEKEENIEKEKDPKLRGQIDMVCDEIFNLTIEHFMMVNIDLDTKCKDMLRKDASEEIREVIENIRVRLGKIDHVQFLTKTVLEIVTKHFEKYRNFLTSEDANVAFITFGHLKSIETEKAYLNKLSGVLALHLLPDSYNKNRMLKCLVRDILTNYILFPFIDKVSDPDFLNTKAINTIKKYEKPEVLLETSLPWNKLENQHIVNQELSLENILFLINLANTAEDFETLGSVLTSIQFQIDAIQYLDKKDEEESISGKLKMDRKLEDIVDLPLEELTSFDWIEVLLELNKSKLVCNLKLEEILLKLNSQHFTESDICFSSIMGNPITRKYFNDYLEISGSQSLLGFWEAAEELRVSEKDLWHELGTQIFYTYINRPMAALPLDKSYLKRIESFLVGDSGPDVFFDIQENVLTILENDHFEGFSQSEFFANLILECKDTDFKERIPKPSLEESEPKPDSIDQLDNSSLAKSRLELVEEQITNKIQAQKALKTSLKPDSKVLQNIADEILSLESEKSEILLHLDQTESWTANLGLWQCRLHQVSPVLNKDIYNANLVVYVPQEHIHMTKDLPVRGPHSWLVNRTLPDFHLLQKRLQPYFGWVRQLDLPPTSKPIFGKLSDKAHIDKAKIQLQRFMDAILSDDFVSSSELVYAFLSPSPDHLKLVPEQEKKNKFNKLAQMFKSNDLKVKEGNDEESMLMEEFQDKVPDVKDTIAEPFYALISEIFDLKGVFKWLRKTLVTFVQISFGRTISRQLSDTANWLVGEAMVVYYLCMLKNSIWKNGKLKAALEKKTEEQKLTTQEEAKYLILDNVPEIITKVVGVQTARQGTDKVFEILQDQMLNKHLIYSLLEAFIKEFIPELEKTRVALKLKQFS